MKTPQGSDEIDPNPTSSDASSKETDELLPDETLSSAQGASAWAIMFGSLLAVSCAFALPFASFAAGVGFWVSQYSKLTWVIWNLLGALPLPAVVLVQYFLDRKFNVSHTRTHLSIPGRVRCLQGDAVPGTCWHCWRSRDFGIHSLGRGGKSRTLLSLGCLKCRSLSDCHWEHVPAGVLPK